MRFFMKFLKFNEKRELRLQFALAESKCSAFEKKIHFNTINHFGCRPLGRNGTTGQEKKGGFFSTQS